MVNLYLAARLETQIFGLAYDSEGVPVGTLGLAPSLFGWDSSYPYVLDTLFYQGYINSRAFSLDLRSIESDQGMDFHLHNWDSLTD